MSKNYIRVYCNGTKTRSTGKIKWYREAVMKELGISYIDNTQYRYEVCKTLLSIVNKADPSDKYEFTVDLIHVNKSGKTVVKTIKSPYTFRKASEYPEQDLRSIRLYEVFNSKDELIAYVDVRHGVNLFTYKPNIIGRL